MTVDQVDQGDTEPQKEAPQAETVEKGGDVDDDVDEEVDEEVDEDVDEDGDEGEGVVFEPTKPLAGIFTCNDCDEMYQGFKVRSTNGQTSDGLDAVDLGRVVLTRLCKTFPKMSNFFSVLRETHEGGARERRGSVCREGEGLETQLHYSRWAREDAAF